MTASRAMGGPPAGFGANSRRAGNGKSQTKWPPVGGHKEPHVGRASATATARTTCRALARDARGRLRRGPRRGREQALERGELAGRERDEAQPHLFAVAPHDLGAHEQRLLAHAAVEREPDLAAQRQRSRRGDTQAGPREILREQRVRLGFALPADRLDAPVVAVARRTAPLDLIRPDVVERVRAASSRRPGPRTPRPALRAAASPGCRARCPRADPGGARSRADPSCRSRSRR